MLNKIDLLMEQTLETDESLLILIALGAQQAELFADAIGETGEACRARYIGRKIDEILGYDSEKGEFKNDNIHGI